MMQRVKGLLAAVVILGILVGVPALLVALAQVPGFLPPMSRLSSLLLAPDDGKVLLVIIWAAAWLVWAWMTWLLLAEIAVVAHTIKAPQLRPVSVSMPRGLARSLVVAAAALVVTVPSMAHAAGGDTGAAPIEAQRPSAVASVTPAPAQDVEDTTEAEVTAPLDDSTAPAADIHVTVAEGDTLWDLAAQHLGDPHRWKEIFAANKGIEQPDGRSLQQPDHIDIGWQLTIPTAVPSNDTDDVDTAEVRDSRSGTGLSHHEVETPEADQGTATTSKRPEATKVDTTTDHEAEAEQQEPSWMIAGLSGAGIVLGAGLGAWVLRNRREQFRTRRPGRVITAPPPVVAPIEKTAMAAAEMSFRTVARLDAVLRRITTGGPVPAITAVGIRRDGGIMLRTEDQMPTPWQAVDEGWLLPAHVTVDELPDAQPDQPAPYPLLVTIGSDDAHTIWLLNLEATGTVTIGGDATMTADFARYLAAEMAVNPWSAGVRVACVGHSEAVVPMAPDRLDADLAEIHDIGTTNARRADTADVDAATGRWLQAEGEAWGAAAVVTDPQAEGVDALHQLVGDHPHQTGVAIVTVGDGVDFTITAEGRVHAAGFDLVAVGLTEAEAAGCAALLTAAAAQEDSEPPAADELLDVTGNLLPTHRIDRDDEIPESVEPVLPDDDASYLETAAVVEEDLDTLAPRTPEPVSLELIERDPNLDACVAEWFADHPTIPRLSLLGPVTARTVGKPIAKQKAYYTEALAFLALHPQGVTAEVFAEAFDITVQRARTVVSQLRSWVGVHPDTREPFVPDAKASELAKARGVGLYLVDGILTDVDLFRRLRARGIARGAAGIEDLETALRLVSGRPFDQLRPKGWSWLLDGDRVDHHMVCAVGDVAHVVTTHHLRAGDLDAAKHAASIGIQADPDSETARMDLAAIVIHEGHSRSAREIIAEVLGDDADLDATERTIEIFTRNHWLETG